MMLYNDNLLNVGRHGQQAEDQHVNDRTEAFICDSTRCDKRHFLFVRFVKN